MIGLRKDGYHNLQSFFQAINLMDQITLSRSSQDEYISNDHTLIFNDKNFVFCALELFRQKTKMLDPVRIELYKEIPKGAGLGGGSSNIATMLWGLNELFTTGYSQSDLQLWSSELSSDAPFFFSHGSAVCEGRGEIVTNYPMPKQKEFMWIIKPSYALSTPEVYLYSKKTSKITSSLEGLVESLYSDDPQHFNDLEEAAFLINPQLALLKDELEYLGFSHVFMSGSGSSLVCIGQEMPKIKSPVQIFPIQYINRVPSQWYLRNSYAITR